MAGVRRCRPSVGFRASERRASNHRPSSVEHPTIIRRASSIRPSSVEEDGTERRKKKRRAALDPYLATRGARPPERKVVSSMLTVLDDWFTRAVGAHRKARSSALASWWTRRASVIVGRSSSVVVRPSVVEHPSVNHRASDRRPLSIRALAVDCRASEHRPLTIQASTVDHLSRPLSIRPSTVEHPSVNH